MNGEGKTKELPQCSDEIMNLPSYPVQTKELYAFFFVCMRNPLSSLESSRDRFFSSNREILENSSKSGRKNRIFPRSIRFPK